MNALRFQLWETAERGGQGVAGSTGDRLALRVPLRFQIANGEKKGPEGPFLGPLATV